MAVVPCCLIQGSAIGFASVEQNKKIGTEGGVKMDLNVKKEKKGEQKIEKTVRHRGIILISGSFDTEVC